MLLFIQEESLNLAGKGKMTDELSCKAVLVLQLNIAKPVFIMASFSMNLGRKQNNTPLFDHYLFCSLNRTGSLGRNIYEYSVEVRYQDALKLSAYLRLN